MILQSTFVLLKGIGPHTERQLWEAGVSDWRKFLACSSLPGIGPQRKRLYDDALAEALSQYQAKESRYFAKTLKPRDHWRLYDAFKERALFLEIETTGGPAEHGEVTVVGLYRRGEMISLVRGDSLTEARLNRELSESDLLVTFFGSVFDLPYLRAKFPGLVIDQPHFDLCFAARRLGIEGGLKRIETAFGIERHRDLHGLDGWEAVRLWQAWRAGESEALALLLRYNESDTRNLEPLADQLVGRLTERYGPIWHRQVATPTPGTVHAF